MEERRVLNRRADVCDVSELIERIAKVEERISANEKLVSHNFDYQREIVSTALQSSERAITKSENAHEKRLDSMNEFRQQLKDQQQTFIPRLEYEQNHRTLDDKISLNLRMIEKNEGKSSGIYIAWMVFISLFGIATTLIAIVWHK